MSRDVVLNEHLFTLLNQGKLKSDGSNIKVIQLQFEDVQMDDAQLSSAN